MNYGGCGGNYNNTFQAIAQIDAILDFWVQVHLVCTGSISTCLNDLNFESFWEY